MYRALRRTAGLTTLAGCALAGTAIARPPVVVPPHPLGNPGDWVTPTITRPVPCTTMKPEMLASC
jgi:hypothetical protein